MISESGNQSASNASGNESSDVNYGVEFVHYLIVAIIAGFVSIKTTKALEKGQKKANKSNLPLDNPKDLG